MAEPRTQTVVKGQQTPLDKNVFTNPSGEIFIGWNTERDGTGISYQDQQNIITEEELDLYAQWGYQIDWNSNGGSAVQPWQKKTNTQLENLPTTTRTNFTFDGWYTAASGGTKIEPTTLVTSPATYYAHWTGQIWTVTHNQYKNQTYLFKDIPKGTYNLLELNIIDVYHMGDRTEHRYVPWIRVVNSESTNKWTNYAINGTLSTKYTTRVKIMDNVAVVNNEEIKYETGVVISEMQYSHATFSIKNMSITLPYAKNTIQITGYDVESCGKWKLLPETKSDEIKASLQKIS